ncbi:Integral membrane protein GPR155 [Eumeta japonica]|uniref:Integral membrane protein GPR155 n=1 Tax=Eumeta variegata TaxID=151549 RepID=A0A4C1Z6M5_EUMVA|nr:Integral membrane protein GPR155 [Eumeta japonica]
MAPISLAILNPVAFILMEISKQRENLAVSVMGQAFSGSALFLLGLRMVGQFYRLRGPSLVLPFVLIMVKLIILPVVMRESVSALHAGNNSSETQSLSTYAFLYGTIPTAPAVFVFSNQYQLEIDLILLAVTVIWGGPKPEFIQSAGYVVLQAIRIFSMFSYALWIAMLAMGMLLLQSRGPCFLVTLWPVLGFVAWGAPTVMVAVLLATKAQTGNLEDKSTNAIRLCLLVFCLTVCTGSLIAYLRFRRNNVQSALVADVVSSGPSPPDESSALIENAEPISQSQSLSINGCYGAITATPSPSKSINGCCSNDPNCENGLQRSQDIEDMGNANRECDCPPSHKTCVDANGACLYVADLERAASSLGLLPEETAGRGGQLLRHTVYGADTLVLPSVDDLSFETRHVCEQFISHHLNRCKEAIARDTRWRMRTHRGVFRGTCLVRWLIDCGLAKDEFEAVQYGRHLLDGRLIIHVNNAHHFTNSQLLYVFK